MLLDWLFLRKEAKIGRYLLSITGIISYYDSLFQSCSTKSLWFSASNCPMIVNGSSLLCIDTATKFTNCYCSCPRSVSSISTSLYWSIFRLASSCSNQIVVAGGSVVPFHNVKKSTFLNPDNILSPCVFHLTSVFRSGTCRNSNITPAAASFCYLIASTSLWVVPASDGILISILTC